jgi:hypothetical protein
MENGIEERFPGAQGNPREMQERISSDCGTFMRIADIIGEQGAS